MKRAAAIKDQYHHGDLRAALVEAAEAELIENGIEKFSLRGCARRAGVSHAAPMYHFGSADGLLVALAMVGFSRLGEMMAGHMADTTTPRARLLASGCGYVAFAVANPALFKLMFSSACAKDEAEQSSGPAAEAFAVLRSNVEAAAGEKDEEALLIDIAAAWSIVHGLSHLLIEGVPLLSAEMPEATRNAAIAAIVAQALPGPSEMPATEPSQDQRPAL